VWSGIAQPEWCPAAAAPALGPALAAMGLVPLSAAGAGPGPGSGPGVGPGPGGKFVGLGPGPERGATMATVPTLYAHPESVVLEEKMHQYPAEEIEHSVDDEFLRYFAPPRGSTKRTYPPHFATFAFINRLDTESKIA